MIRPHHLRNGGRLTWAQETMWWMGLQVGKYDWKICRAAMRPYVKLLWPLVNVLALWSVTEFVMCSMKFSFFSNYQHLEIMHSKYGRHLVSGMNCPVTLSFQGLCDNRGLVFYGVVSTRCCAIAVYMLWPCVRLCVCYNSLFYRNGWTDRADFSHRGLFDLSYTVLYGNSVISTNKGTSFWNFVPKLRT